MVDTTVLEAVALRCESSSLSPGTKEYKEISSEKIWEFSIFVHDEKRDLKSNMESSAKLIYSGYQRK